MKNIALLIFMIFSLIEVSHLTAQSGIKLLLEGPNDATLSDGSGILQIGKSDGLNVVFDRNEILARDSSANAFLYLNIEGGGVKTGHEDTPSDLYVTGYAKLGNNNNNPYFRVHNESGVGSGGITIDLNLPADVTSAAQMMIVQVHRFSGGTSYRPVSIGVFNTLAITVNEVIPDGTAYRVTIIYRN